MRDKISSLLPNVTSGTINKVLLLEVYFLLKAGQSPAYFTLSDFVDNYSIELFYIAVLLAMLTGWLVLPALAFYYALGGCLSWLGRKIMSLIKVEGVPIFTALTQNERENSVSIGVASDYAKSNPDSGLKERLVEYEKTAREIWTNEALAATNFVLVGLIAWISYSTGAPNFLMKVASFADSFSYGLAYEVCLILLAIQGLVGRAANFHRLRASGSLPPSFFNNEKERADVEAWAQKMIEEQNPLASKWLKNES